MHQIVALLIDSYRLLLAKKLFWVAMGISFLVAVLFASISFTANGFSILFGLFELNSRFVAEESPLARPAYLWIFSSVVLKLWLTKGAVILGLISTGGIFNELMRPGAIDLMVSKPISRWKLFFTKYLGSLLFVFLQVVPFAIVLFLCLGWRLGEWNPRVFLTIPIVTLVFSYLYAVQVFASMITRSTIAALLIVFAFWAGIALMQVADGGLARVEVVSNLEQLVTPASEEDAEKGTVSSWRRGIRSLLAPLPKMRATTQILDTQLELESDFELDAIGKERTAEDTALREAKVQGSPLYVIGTSLLFEGFILLLAGWLFVRRDF